MALFPLSVSSLHPLCLLLPCCSSHLGMGDTDVLHSAQHSILTYSENFDKLCINYYFNNKKILWLRLRATIVSGYQYKYLQAV